MQNLGKTRARLRTAAVLPVAVVAWLTLGTGAAMAAPSVHAADAAASTPAATSQPASSPDGNGKGNGNGNGQAKGHDKGSGSQDSGSTSQDSTTTSGSSDHSSGNAGTSGDPSQPQPPSNADQNSGGANGKCPGGPYCSTRDGSPSGNGNGNGKATGKPCAGCVGKADNKNPKGQYPNGSDHNAGYECDRNHGIGRTNPAHTGCRSTPPPCDSATQDCGGGGGCDTATEDCGGGGCDEATEDCGGGGCDEATEDCGGGGCDTATEDCGGGDCDTATTDCGENDCTTDEDCGTPPPACVPTEANNFCSTVEGEHHTRSPKPTTKVLGEKVTRTPSALPFTGAAGIGLMLGTAALAVTVGGGLMIATRRRRGELG